MNILDWFDIDNPKHLLTYKQLQNTGLWPEGFIPKDIKFTSCWQVILDSRLANRFIEEKLSGDIVKLRRIAVGGLLIDGGHHKQWHLEQILIALGVDLEQLWIDLKSKGHEWEHGIAP